MLIKLIALSALLVMGGNASANTLESQVSAAEIRVLSVRSGSGGTGADVRLMGSQPVILQAMEGATEADIQWANHVRQAYELALAVGCGPLEFTLVTQSLDQLRSISVEGALPITGNDPGQVLSQFFKALIRNSDTVSLDLYVAVIDAPDEWQAMLEAIRTASVSTPSLIAGTGHRFSLPVVMEPGGEFASAHSPTPGINVDFVSFSGGTVDMTITADAAVPKGLHPVYFYGKDSKFEPAARIDLRIDPPQN